MPGPVDVLRHHDADDLAQAAAARLVTTIIERQASDGTASVALTGGGIGTAVLTALAQSPARDAIDWKRLDVWWGDERFVASGSPDRNETGARAALLDLVPVDPARVHPFASPEQCGGDVDVCASRYADELRAWGGDAPCIDVTLLGIGPDAHVASLFPEMPALHDDRLACAVRGAPKPPPVRTTLTMGTLRSSREVWILAAGAEKAAAVRLALSPGAGPLQVPAAGARGRLRTLVLVDEAAASDLPADFGRVEA